MFKRTPFFTLLEREIKRFQTVLFQTVVTPLISSSLYLLIFGVSLDIQLDSGITYLSFLIPGLVMMGCLNNSYQNSSSTIVSSKFTGELQDYKVSALTVTDMIWAFSVGGLFRGMLVGSITFVVGTVFHYYMHGSFLAVQNPMILFFFLIVGGLSFAKLGLSVAIWANNFDQLSAVGSFVLVPLIYLGGVFFSLDKLPEFWQMVSKFNPMLYFINGVRYGILGESDVNLGLAALISVVSLVGFHIIAQRSLRTSSYKGW